MRQIDAQRRLGQALLTFSLLHIVLQFGVSIARRFAGIVTAVMWQALRMQFSTVAQLAAGVPLSDAEFEAGLDFLRDLTEWEEEGDDDES